MLPAWCVCGCEMKKRDSIIQPKDGRCFLCGMLDHEEHKYWSYIEKHHVFFGSNRKHSEEDGLTVYLCVAHHRTGKAAVHQNRESDLILKRYAQEIYERDHTREEFRTRYGKSYL